MSAQFWSHTLTSSIQNSEDEIGNTFMVDGVVQRSPLVFPTMYIIPGCVCILLEWGSIGIRGNISTPGTSRAPRAFENPQAIVCPTLQDNANMRRRSTFVHDPALDVDPRQLYLSGDRFVIETLRAVREEKLTVGFNELPEEVIRLQVLILEMC